MNILGQNTEQRIIGLFDRGDASAMDALYAEYADYLTGVCFRYITDKDDLKDVLQESFIKIFTQINKFEYRGKGSLKAWMSRIVANEALMFLRKNNSIEDRLEKELPDLPDEDPDVGGLAGEVLAEMIRQLPTGYRTVFNLFVIEGYSHKQIAEQLNIKPDTSASQFNKARKMLARMIKDYNKKNDKI